MSEARERYYKGEIRDIKFYNHILTDKEIEEEYNKKNEQDK